MLVDEFIPRKDVNNPEVAICNQMLNDSVKNLRNVTLPDRNIPWQQHNRM